MKEATKPHKPDEKKYVFTEGIDYSTTGKESIWGRGDSDTLKLLYDVEIKGKWLNLASGDGRYNIELLKKADFVVASDIDEGAISKLWHNTPDRYKDRLEVKAFDITKRFPLEDSSFDGVFSTGFLHLFPEKILNNILAEIDRILKSKGVLIIDFATDIRRVLSNGELYLKKGETRYEFKNALGILKELLRNYKIQIQESEVKDEDFKTSERSYKFNCKFILLVAKKI